MGRRLSALKNLVVPAGRKIRRLPVGALKGLNFDIDLKSEMLIYMGLWEIELTRWFDRFSRDARTAIDVGGAEGYYTLFFLRRTPVRRVFVFEPLRERRERLERNLDANPRLGRDRVELSEKLVGASDDSRHVALDSLISRVEFPCVVKMDIEGGELDALRGATRLVGMRDVRWIIEVHSESLLRDCTALLAQSGYRVTEIPRSPIRRVLPEHRPDAFNSWIVAERTA